MPKRTLRALLTDPEHRILVVPGAHNAFAAKLIEQRGFSAAYVTGSGTASMLYGLPDVGLVTMTEMLYNASLIAQAVEIPIICDCDTGYGNAINVIRTVQQFERGGVAAIQLEDQTFPKKCGHMDNKQLISRGEMAGKIRAAVDARTSQETLIVARSDARAVTNIDDAVRRLTAYAEAGADILFPEAMQTPDEFAYMARRLQGVPLLANMTEWGKSPVLTAEELADMGYRIVIFPSAPMRAAQQAMVDLLDELKAKGTQRGFLERMYHRRNLYQTVSLPQIHAWEKQYLTEDE